VVTEILQEHAVVRNISSMFLQKGEKYLPDYILIHHEDHGLNLHCWENIKSHMAHTLALHFKHFGNIIIHGEHLWSNIMLGGLLVAKQRFQVYGVIGCKILIL